MCLCMCVSGEGGGGGDLTTFINNLNPPAACILTFLHNIDFSRDRISCNCFFLNQCWLVGCFGLNGTLRQYFSLYRAVCQKEGERREK